MPAYWVPSSAPQVRLSGRPEISTVSKLDRAYFVAAVTIATAAEKYASLSLGRKPIVARAPFLSGFMSFIIDMQWKVERR